MKYYISIVRNRHDDSRIVLANPRVTSLKWMSTFAFKWIKIKQEIRLLSYSSPSSRAEEAHVPSGYHQNAGFEHFHDHGRVYRAVLL